MDRGFTVVGVMLYNNLLYRCDFLSAKPFQDQTFRLLLAHFGVAADGCSHILSNLQAAFHIRIIPICYVKRKVLYCNIFPNLLQFNERTTIFTLTDTL